MSSKDVLLAEAQKRPEKFSVKDLSSDENKWYTKLVNESFFYRGHPAALVVAGLTYAALLKRRPDLSYMGKLVGCMGTSLMASAVARDSYMPTIQEKATQELPSDSYLRRCIENGLVFKPIIFKSINFVTVSEIPTRLPNDYSLTAKNDLNSPANDKNNNQIQNHFSEVNSKEEVQLNKYGDRVL